MTPSHFLWNFCTSYDNFALLVKPSHFLWNLQFQIEWNPKRRINDRWWWWSLRCEYSDALNASNTHWSFQWGLKNQGKENLNSCSGLLQQGLRSGGKLSRGKKLVHGDANLCMIVCNYFLLCWVLDVLSFVWYYYMIKLI